MWIDFVLYILIVYYIFVNKITRWTGFQTFHQLRLHTGFSFSNGFFGGFFGIFFGIRRKRLWHKIHTNTCLSCLLNIASQRWICPLGSYYTEVRQTQFNLVEDIAVSLNSETNGSLPEFWSISLNLAITVK